MHLRSGAGKVGEGGLGKFYCEVQRLETIQMEVGVIPLFTVIDVFTNIIFISDRYYSWWKKSGYITTWDDPKTL